MGQTLKRLFGLKTGNTGSGPRGRDSPSPQKQLYYLSPEEVHRVFCTMTAEAREALEKTAKHYAAMTRYGPDAWEDLLQEALLRAMDGRRLWPSGASPMLFLAGRFGVIRSIAWEWRKNAERKNKNGGDIFIAEALSYIQIANRGVRHDSLGWESVASAYGLYKDDPIAQAIFIQMVEGATSVEVREELNLTEVEYESKRRKIKRRYLRNFGRAVP